MIVRRLLSFVACLSIGWFSSCDHERLDIVHTGRLSLSLQPVASSSTGRVSAGENVSKVLVSIETSKGELVYNLKEFKIFKFGDDYLTEELDLPVESYRITKFFAIDPDNNVVYATPVTGSKYASLVDRPLPIGFSILSEITSMLVLEVVSVEEQKPADFGYLSFQFKIIETRSIGIIVEPPNYTLEVIAKDAPLGNVMWTGSWNFEGRSSIKIPTGYGHYTFKASKEGFVEHVQHYMAEDLSDVDQIAFELLDDRLQDFVVKSTDGITAYFPKDNCKLYVRVDVPEGYKIDYILTDKGPEHFVECFRHCRPVNIFGDKPFGRADTYCSGYASIIIDYYPPNETDSAIAYFLQEY